VAGFERRALGIALTNKGEVWGSIYVLQLVTTLPVCIKAASFPGKLGGFLPGQRTTTMMRVFIIIYKVIHIKSALKSEKIKDNIYFPAQIDRVWKTMKPQRKLLFPHLSVNLL
jgi:hypothetical protein